MLANVIILTYSALAAFRLCPRKYWLRYVLGLSRVRRAVALRFGDCFHRGLEAFRKGASSEEAIATAMAPYQTCPDYADPVAWAVERETLRQLLAGHLWRYSQDNVQYVAVELVFELPLVNQMTGLVARQFIVKGKIDAIVQIADGRLCVAEVKTSSEDLSAASEFWPRLRCDSQISLYMLAARALGYNAATVLYDVTRKPTIRLRQKETPEQYSQRLYADINSRPDYYFARREIPRLEDELSEFRLELWQQAQALQTALKHGYWYRSVSRTNCSTCEYSGICLGGAHVEPGGPPPSGFEFVEDRHPELSR
jgi:CRISPR/Cas system-associated exonuclease Cas4 (RecB family)